MSDNKEASSGEDTVARSAMKLALEALYYLPALSPAQNELQDDAIEALEEALAKQEQGEPVRDHSCKVCGNKPDAEGLLEHGSGCYTQSAEGGGIEFILDAVEQEQGVDWQDMYEKEKRRSAMWIAKYEKDIGPLKYATPQQEQRNVSEHLGEPVAYLCENGVGHRYFRWKKPSSTYKPIPLYTTPQPVQKPWVGLTDEERIIMSCYDLEWAALIGQVQRKLKEKNT